MVNFINYQGREYMIFESRDHFERFKEKVLDLEDINVYTGQKMTGLKFLQLCRKKEVSQSDKKILYDHITVFIVTDPRLGKIWMETARSDNKELMNYDDEDYDEVDDYDDEDYDEDSDD